MESQQARKLISKFISSQHLLETDEQQLLNWLEQKTENRDEYLENEAMDSLLDCLARLEGTEDQFVEATLKSISEQKKFNFDVETEHGVVEHRELNSKEHNVSVISTDSSKTIWMKKWVISDFSPRILPILTKA